MLDNLTNFDFDFDERAVSPVVGVILMVAITVILAAVIGTFVLDLGGQVEQNAQAGVSFDQEPGNSIATTDRNDGSTPTQTYNVTVQAISMSNAESLNVTFSDNDNTAKDPDPSTTGSTLNDSFETVSGSPISSSGGQATVSGLTPGDQVTVVGTTESGNENVIQTYTVEA